MASVAEGAGQEVQPLPDDYVVDPKRDRLVIVASSLGTVFEWYDFFIYGTLAPVIATLFFPAGNPTASLFCGTRPRSEPALAYDRSGAILFGILGDRLGRKYTFLVTITLMGFATAAVGLLPTYAQAAILAPVLLVVVPAAPGPRARRRIWRRGDLRRRARPATTSAASIPASSRRA